MKQIELKAFAKINLCLDVTGLLPNGFHQVEMVMQQILLHDDVNMEWIPDEPAAETVRESNAETTHESASPAGDAAQDGSDCAAESFRIKLTTNRRYLPTDERNLAYKAALLMHEKHGKGRSGELKIHIKKRIPVAAGMAGGSSNGAAVLHGLNVLWDLDLDVQSLCGIGAELGSDVPFCIMGQAAGNWSLANRFENDPYACHCAVATGTGTTMQPVTGLRSHLVLSKPPISVSTAEVYKGIDEVDIPEHPDLPELVDGLKSKNRQTIEKNMVNVLENYTLKQYPIVVYTKNKIKERCSGKVLMSGSGPTVFGLCKSREEAQELCDIMTLENKESFWTRTTW